MFYKMMSFEWRYFVRQPSFIVTCLVFFLLPYLSMVFDGVQIGSGGNVNLNSPFAIAQSTLIFSIFAMFLVVNFVSNTALRNDLFASSELIYSAPIPPFSYQFGRFFGSFLVTILVFSMVPLGLLIGSVMPWLDAERLGPLNMFAYIMPFAFVSIPTLFVLSALFYVAALRFRSIMAVYLVALAVFIIYSVSGGVFSDPEYRTILALTDPFGLRSFSELTRYWTPAERNTLVLPLREVILYNRLIWVGVALVILFGFGKLFSELTLRSPKKVKNNSQSKQVPPLSNNISYTYDHNSTFKQFKTRTLFEIKQVLLSPGFSILLIFSAFTLISQFVDPSGFYGAENWPLTQYMVSLIEGSFGISLIIIITFYSAEIVWRERTTGIGDIIDSMPVPNVTLWLSKFIAVVLVIVSVLVVGVVAAIANQLIKGFLNVDIVQYFVSLLYFNALPWILLAVLAFFIQALSPNKYVGMLIFVAYFFVSLAFYEIGLEHNMFNFGAAPQLIYSDMNEYGWYMTTQHYYMGYWVSLSIVLACLSYALWHRGAETSLKQRIYLLGYELGKKGQALIVIFTVCFISLGTIIHYNTRVTNQFLSSEQLLDLRSEYEKRFSQYETYPVPTVISVELDAAIFPNLRKLDVIAKIEIENKQQVPIERFLVNFPMYSQSKFKDLPITEFNADYRNGWLNLEKALSPGETRQIELSLTRQHFGFKDSGEDFSLVENGTFINNFELLPSFGVDQSFYIADQHERRKRDLPPPKRANKLEDESKYNESFFGPNVGLIDFKAKLSTSAEQIAIAPGYLKKYWTEANRNYFVYEMDSPMVNFFNIMSADLKVKSSMHNGVNISVYYHPEHNWNIDRMIKATEDSLDYFSEAFGPYQHKQLRIIEFPGYRSFAQSFANTVPYSEQIGFITDLRDKTNIDPVYYVTAHEVAHQWFGHQLNAANVQGSAVLSESLSQYAALQVMKKEYGEVKIRKFLTYELDSYLRGRTTEYLEEMPFMRSESQQYIHYRKGSVVMMSIADRIGESNMNKALASLIEQYKFSESRQPTTLDLLKAIKQVSDENDHPYIEQQFKQITIYDLRMKETETFFDDKNPSLRLTVEASQFEADGLGNESKQKFNDLVEIVLFDSDPNAFAQETKIIYREKHLLEDGENGITIDLSDIDEALIKQIKYVGVDPFVRYIDRDSKNNIKKL